jgi:hypothetical protein
VDPVTLETILSLCSHVNPDWISALHVLRPNKKLDDVILATTISGTVKVWTINEQEYKERAALHENESKQIKTKNVSTLTCCLYNNRTVLIVSDRAWEVKSFCFSKLHFLLNIYFARFMTPEISLS